MAINIPQLPGQYSIREVEKKWQNVWAESGVYKWDEHASREDSFIIDTPPPTVSGLLHIGHVFSYTHTDFIARYQRMRGKNVFYPIGFDDNGLPTERLVEKVKNIRAVNMSRQEFIDICTEVVESAEEDFRDLFRSLALSVDWNLEYQTISSHCRKLSQASFIELYTKNQAYRQMQPCLWDPVDQTALAQADVVDKELTTMMNEIIFTTESDEALVVATTRPELLAACVAVFFHPEDKRYQHLHNKYAFTPLFSVKVPILADTHVDMEKGTGLVMCCTFGDITDVAWWRSYKLPARIIIDNTGKIYNLEAIGSTDWPSRDVKAAKEFASNITGCKVKEAREKTIEMLKMHGLLKSQNEIKHSVKCAERSGSPLEILLTPQWFIKILDIKENLLRRASECNWHPGFMKSRLDDWIKGLNWDWCISRQRFFGVPFPVWYSKRAGEEGKVLVANKEDLPIDPLVSAPRGYTKEEVEPDMDVMDTWATSSISPQLNSHGISENYAVNMERHKKLFPADLRPQAHEIIRTWAFYTIVKAELHQHTIPWKNIMISGWCLAPDKTKMSKSKGNVITPANLIEEKGVDVLRYWASTARLGADTVFSEDVLAVGKKLVNKLWNASKFVAIHLEKLEARPEIAKVQISQGIISHPLDLWILSRLFRTINQAAAEFDRYEYCNARISIEEFFWKDFCDNYLELIKVRAYNESGDDKKGQTSAINTLYHCLEAIIKLFAPFLPHITEEIYNAIFVAKGMEAQSVHAKNSWPLSERYYFDELAERSGITCVHILNVVRKVKAERQLSLKAVIDELRIARSSKDQDSNIALDTIVRDLANVTNSTQVIFEDIAAEGVEYISTEDGMYKVHVAISVAN